MSAAAIGYRRLLQEEPAFRRLWLAQVVSELGDWLNLVALLLVVDSLSASARATGLVLILEMLPLVVWSPFAGMIADRFDRRRIMIAADVLRAVIVLGFLLVDEPDELWILYALAFAQFSMTAFFEPARSALLPSLVSARNLVAANALSGITWSVMLAVGGALGGLITALLSVRAAFVLDAATFLVSAAILVGMPSPAAEEAARGPGRSISAALGLLFRNPRLRAILLIKTGMTVTGGALWLLSAIWGQQVFPIGRDGSISVGLFYCSHGVGAILGAAAARSTFGAGLRRTMTAILAAFALRAVFFVGLGASPDLFSAVLAVVAASACGSLLWVTSTTLLHAHTPDEVRGRIFGLDWAGLTLGMALAIHFCGTALDEWGLTPHEVAFLVAGLGALVTIWWWWVLLRWDRLGGELVREGEEVC